MTLFLPWIFGGKYNRVFPAQPLADSILSASWQRRDNPEAHPILMQIAQSKADEMARLNYFSHTSPTGETANEFIRNRGYRLPNWYPEEGNSCESLRLGPNSIEDCIQAWLGSPPHRAHITGETDFYANQECIGTGTASDPDGGTIWVFMSAPRMDSE